MAESVLTIQILNSRPIELADLTQSLFSIADEFRRFVEENDPEAAAGDVRLYVKDIRAGSVLADIIAVSPLLLQHASYVNTVVSFGKHLKAAYDFLSGNTTEKPDLDKNSYENLTRIVEPIAKDHGSQLNIGHVGGNVYVSVTSPQANAVQNTARREIEVLDEPTSKLHEKVLLYWFQARADPKETLQNVISWST